MSKVIDFQTDPEQYRHWHVEYNEVSASLYMDVDEKAGLYPGYDLKLNSYDLGVDIELADIVQRMRFEHPEVKSVVLRSGKDNVFCAGANIRMLAGAAHTHKVNFCKFTNETRNTFETAGIDSGQYYICAIKGSCAGGGYELALACNYIILTDDGSSSVSLPEVPLLAVLPGTGGLTRLTDKRKVRRDHADVFCTLEEGVRGQRALQWRLVDELASNTRFEKVISARAHEFARQSNKDIDLKGITLPALERRFSEDGSVYYSTVDVILDRQRGIATIQIAGPSTDVPESIQVLHHEGAQNWMLRCARELDDAILHLRFNELECGVLIFRTRGNLDLLVAHENFHIENQDDWLVNEILTYWKRLLKRIDMTSRSLLALVEPGSCFAGTLAELLFSVDRSYMADGDFEDDPRPIAAIRLSDANFGFYPMSNGLTRLQTRFLGSPESVDEAMQKIDCRLEATAAEALGLVTFALDELDWEDDVRVFIEERVSYSPDALSAMEANLRFAGPETMETRIFGRLTAWQNWVFQRPNAVGEKGALKRYGSGIRSEYDKRRV